VLNRVAAMTILVLGSMTAPLCAQTGGGGTGTGDGGPDPATVRVRLGPVWMNPRLEFKDIGIDTNVFNDPPDQNPKRDFTATVSPTLDMWLRIGRSWLQSTIREDLVWYQEYSSERSANESYTISWRLPLNRVSFAFSPTYLSTRDRPGYEIDTRAQRTEWGGTLSADIRALSKTSFGVTTTYQAVTFASDAQYCPGGACVNLNDELSRTESSAAIAVNHKLTPLTTLNFSGGADLTRFRHSGVRDSDSINFGAGLAFDPHALLKGSAQFGYRDFRPRDPLVPAYQGFTATGNLSYTLLGMTRFDGQFKRDVSYSYDSSQPYYLEGTIGGSVAQQVFGPFDVMVRGMFSNLAYRDLSGVAVAVVDRVDQVHSYGGGVGYHVGGGGARLGFNIDQQRRVSALADHRYNGLKYGFSWTYDF